MLKRLPLISMAISLVLLLVRKLMLIVMLLVVHSL
nr:MAG TPA: hypothetical protein [Bacteriophage sp.]